MNVTIKPRKFAVFLVKTQNSILSAAFIITITTGMNAVLGLIKSRVLTSHFGVSQDLAVFYLAERIPNLIYSVLIVGAVSTVFIPVFTELLSKDKKKAYETASATMNIALLFFLGLSVIMLVFSEQLMGLLLSGVKDQQNVTQQIVLGTQLIKIMAVAQLFLVLGSLLTSLLQSFKYFLFPAIAPIMFNLGMIGGVLTLSGKYGVFAAAYGTLIGALLHFAIQIPIVLKTGFKYRISFDLKDKGLIQTLKLIPPRIASVLMANVAALVNNALALLISYEAVVYIKLASQLQTLPVNLFGLSMASALLPTLSEEADNKEKFKKTFLTSLHQTMFLVLPVSAILFVLRLPAVRLTYGVANFPWQATLVTAYALAFYSVSIFAQSANYLTTRAFYALKDTFTPIKVGAVTTILSIAISYTLITQIKMGPEAIAIAFSITSFIDMIVLIALLNKKVGGFGIEKLIKPFAKIAFSAFLMAITLYFFMKILDVRVLDTTKTLNLLLLTGIAGISGSATYLFFTKIFRVEEIELLYKLLRKLNIKGKSVAVPSPEAGINS